MNKSNKWESTFNKIYIYEKPIFTSYSFELLDSKYFNIKLNGHNFIEVSKYEIIHKISRFRVFEA